MDRNTHGKIKFNGTSEGNFVINMADTTFAPKRIIVNTLGGVEGVVAAPLIIEEFQLPVSFAIGGPNGTGISVKLNKFVQGKVKGEVLTNNMAGQETRLVVLAYDGDINS